MANHKLIGRIFLKGDIRAVTGLHIGGSPGALAIGAVDSPIVRDELTGRPYIPGSSLKGKMRSLAEKITDAPQNRPIGNAKIHTAGGIKSKDVSTEEYIRVGKHQYEQYWVNPIFGVPSEIGFDIPAPNRLVVRDIPLDSESEKELMKASPDLPFAEVKWEAVIDRVTAKATPRQIERVPAGAVFSPMELVFSVYLADDVALFNHLLTCLQLVEDDYLGGHGSRGSGKVEFQNLEIVCKRGDTYAAETIQTTKSLAELVAERGDIQTTLKQTLGL